MKTFIAALLLCVSGCVVPNATTCYSTRTPCGSGLPDTVSPRFSETQVPLYSPSGDLQLMPHSQFKTWDTTTPLGTMGQ